jgi:2-keto-4-pentenoate hydratase/2-oxohepta-3-ene-1,7-dioic acid hydratase in catechol pathway
MPREWWCATTTLTTHFIGGAGEGRLVATGRLLRRGQSVAFAAGEVRDERGKIVASATGTWHLWPHRPDRRPPPSSARGTVSMRGTGEPVPVGKILAVGRNYAAHIAEMGNPPSAPPVVFLKPSSALVPDGGEIQLPADAGEVHHEVELVAVIGRRGRHIAPDQAMEHVMGYAVGLDMTLRDVQAAAKKGGEPWSLAKGFDGAAPVSPVTPRGSVGDGSGLEISLKVNGAVRQHGNTSQMLRPVSELVAFCSRWITLEPGDLIFTGTPAGVGPVRSGDVLEAELERVGALCVTVA